MMTYKPDFGLRLLREGITPKVDHFFYDFRLYSLTVLGRGQYSTMVEKPYAGELHALSLDFILVGCRKKQSRDKIELC
jgi:hypothetical protein